MKPRFLALVSLLHLAAAADAGLPDNGADLVSVGLAGAAGDDVSLDPTMSSDGRFVAFESTATNLVQNDTNNARDIFLRDLQTGITLRVSESSGGAQSNGHSYSPAISADGRHIVFQSDATNLVGGDTNTRSDVFLHDRVTGFTTRVSVTSTGLQANAASYSPAISGNGEVIAFTSEATNLYFLGNGGYAQVYAHDTVSGGTYLCSRVVFTPGDHNSYQPHISHDGSRIIFRSSASNLAGGGIPNGTDIFLFEGGTVSLVSRGFNGALPDASSWSPVISGDGSSVAYRSSATNLIAGGTLGEFQVFLYDIASDTTMIVSRSTDGDHGNEESGDASISHDGKRVAFVSRASNLVAFDTGGFNNVFVRDVTTGTTACMTRLPGGQRGGGVYPTLAAGGDCLAFSSGMSYVPGHIGTVDVYLREYGTVSRNAGQNPASYTASRAALGEEWRAIVDLTTTGHTFAVVLGTNAPANGPLGGGRRLLVGGQTIFQLPAQPGPVASWSGVLPADPGLVGLPLYTQAVHIFGVTPFALSNAQDLCLAF